MQNSIKNRAAAAVTAALLLVGVSTPAHAQNWRAQAQAEINYLVNNYPGSTMVYLGCNAVANDELARTGNLDKALVTLAGCASIGCVFTENYNDCLDVNALLFVYDVALS